ncbi:MAG: PEP-CTERM sorting domain-containing protein, partial [Cyanobacteria bacterium J06636_28]
GISRIYGGIHFDDGDLNGRTLGRQVGNKVFARSQLLLQGQSAKSVPTAKSVPEPGVILGLLAVASLAYRRDSARRCAK